MSRLFTDLNRACDRLFAVSGLITKSHVTKMENRIEGAMNFVHYTDIDCKVLLNDKEETITVTVKNGEDTASVILRWEDAEGNLFVRIDTDGDGK